MRETILSLGAAWLLAAGLAAATIAQAGPTDTPLPTFSDASPALHVYNAVGVIKNNNLETVFICTNLDSVTVNVGVEVFDKTGAPGNRFDDPVIPGNGEFLGLLPGETVTFGTSGTEVISVDQRPPDLDPNDGITPGGPKLLGLPTLRNGSGRIVATSKKISCIGIIIDELHPIEVPGLFFAIPPPTAVNLPLFRVP